MITAAILFATAALGGVVIATIRLRGKPYPPKWLAAIHGIVAAAGLVTLIVEATRGTLPTMGIVALIGFGLAALGGLTLFLGFHLKNRPLLIPLVLAHGTTAVISFIFLVMAIFL